MGRVAGRVEWVLLAYRIPREPSTPRITVWRKLRRLGVAQIVDGLVALPLDARTKEQLEWIADEILESGGEATIWVGRVGSARQERALASRMAAGVAEEYRKVASAAREGVGDSAAPSRT
ncbi:MAG TPA: Chromate resistance protein ChrB, partial [Acidimicrobiia bacterium]